MLGLEAGLYPLPLAYAITFALYKNTNVKDIIAPSEIVFSSGSIIGPLKASATSTKLIANSIDNRNLLYSTAIKNGTCQFVTQVHTIK